MEYDTNMEYTEVEVSLDQIRIPDRFKRSKYSHFKYDKKLERYELTGTYGKIIINDNYYLMDGYITYLVLKHKGVEKVIVSIPVRTKNARTYVFGVHPDNKANKEYVWKLSSKTAEKIGYISPGMTLLVNAKNKIVPIIVTKIENTIIPPHNGIIKNVIGAVQ